MKIQKVVLALALVLALVGGVREHAAAAQVRPSVTAVSSGSRAGNPGWTAEFSNGLGVFVPRTIYTGGGPVAGPTSAYAEVQQCFLWHCWTSEVQWTGADGRTFTGRP